MSTVRLQIHLADHTIVECCLRQFIKLQSGIQQMLKRECYRTRITLTSIPQASKTLIRTTSHFMKSVRQHTNSPYSPRNASSMDLIFTRVNTKTTL